jgi:hypothetical protein
MRFPCAALTVVLCVTLTGCLGLRRVPEKKEPKPPKPLGPVKINWGDPGSVVEGFYDAKKRGDWRKAFSCCDFEERLGAEEANKIREEWKKEAPAWPEMYQDSQWLIVDETIHGDFALVSVELIRWSGPAALESERSGFDELVERYGERWKITEFEVMPKVD